jgi:hypothetical protein
MSRKSYYVPHPLSPEQARLRARIAANARWAKEPDRQAAMAPAWAGMEAKFEREVDPEGKLPLVLRAKMAKNAKDAYFLRLQVKALKAREAKKA